MSSLYLSLFQKLRVGAVLVERKAPDTHILLAINEAASRVAGWNEEDRLSFIGKNIADVFEGVREHGLLALYNKALDTQESVSLGSKAYEDSKVPLGVFEIDLLPLTDSHLAITFTNVTRQALAEDRLEARKTHLKQQQEVLSQLVHSLTDNWTNMEAALQQITEAAGQALQVARTGVWLFTETEELLECIDLFEQDTLKHSRGATLIAHHYSNYISALQSDRIIAAHNAHTDPRTKEFSQGYLLPLNISSMLDTPIRLGGRLIGVVCHEHVGPEREWTEEEQTFAASVGDFVSIVLEASERLRTDRELHAREVELAEANQHLQLVLNTIPERVFWKDRDLNYLGCNIAFARDAGLATPEEVIGKDDFGLPWKKYAEMYRAADQEVMSSQAAKLNYEEQLIDFESKESWIRVSKVPFHDSQGNFLGILGTYHDLTEQKQAEVALQRSEERLKVVVDHAPIILWALDLDGVFTFSEGSGLKALGLKPGQVVGLSAFEMYKDHQDITEAINEALKGKEVQVTSFVEDLVYETRYMPLFDEGGQLVGATGVVVDITERIQAEHKLERSLALLRSTLESTADGLLVVDDQGKIARFNDKFAEMWSLPTDSLLGTDDSDAIAHVLDQLVDPDAFVARVDAIYAAPEVESFDTILLKDGRIVERYSQPQILGDTVVGRVWSFRDVTDRERVAEALAEKATALERSNEELEQFAYVASHDLQEPLRTITGFISLLQRRYSGKLDEDADSFFKFIVDGADRMQSLIRDLLAFSRVGRRELTFQSVDLNTILDQTLKDLQHALEEASASVTHDPLPTLQVDPVQVQLLLQNLISNGIKFRGDEACRVHVSAHRRKAFWRLSVQDNGIGIAEKYHDRIFEVFSRLHSQADYTGTGIGLAVCKKIVEQHGGTIWVESEEGAGTTFFFDLPLRAEDGAIVSEIV